MGNPENKLIQVVTSNPLRADSLIRATGGTGHHVPIGMVDEDRAKVVGRNPVPLEKALLQVEQISTYKAMADWRSIGGTEGAYNQALRAGTKNDPENPYTQIVRMSSDTLHLIFNDDGKVMIRHKPQRGELYSVHKDIEKRVNAVLTAITTITDSLRDSMDGVHLETSLFMTQYTMDTISRAKWLQFVRDQGITKLRKICGGVPFAELPFINIEKDFTVSGLNRHDGVVLIHTGRDWNKLDRRQCVDGAFPVQLKEHLDSPGRHLPSRGILYLQ